MNIWIIFIFRYNSSWIYTIKYCSTIQYKKSSGLTGGIIAGIIIAIVASLAIVTGLTIYFKGKKIKSKPLNLDSSKRTIIPKPEFISKV